MKSRFGFVSNSSSTSFVILVKPDKVESVEFILKHLKHEMNGGNPCPTVPERIKELKTEIKDIDKDVIYVDGIFDKINAISDQSFTDHEFLSRYSTYRMLQKEAIRSDRKYPIPRKMRMSRDKEDFLGDIRRLKEDLQEDRAKCETEIQKISGNKDWVFVSFEEDAMWGTLKQMVSDLVKTGDAVVLKQETS